MGGGGGKGPGGTGQPEGQNLFPAEKEVTLALGLWEAGGAGEGTPSGLGLCRARGAPAIPVSSVCAGRQGDLPDEPFFSFVP